MCPRRYRAAVLAAAALSCACGKAPPWAPVNVFASLPVASCAAAVASQPVCDPLAPSAADSALLRALARGEIASASALRNTTGLTWRRVPRPDGELHVRFPASPELSAAYVLEVIRVRQPHDTVLAIASNGGTVVWLNGNLLGASRAAARPARAGQDLYTVSLRGGENRLLYRILTRTADSQFHRSWEASAAVPERLAASIALGAYADLVTAPLFPDSTRFLALNPPQVRLEAQPRIRFRWLTTLGDAMAPGGEYLGGYPARLPLPAGFHGMAVLETAVTDPASSRLLYLQQIPVFSDSTAQRLARRLTAGDPGSDPIRLARVDAVRAAFGLGPGDTIPLPAWLRVQALADLYRSTQQPKSFFRYPGPQVWGYRAADGTVQPYWLIVPPSAVAPAAGRPAGPAPGLVFSVTHMINPSFWLGRGRTTGWVSHMTALSVAYDNFGVLPHLRGRHDFGGFGVEEFGTITRQVASVFRLDTAAVAWLVWSAHGKQALRIARHPDVPLAWLGIAVPALQRELRVLAAELDSIRPVRPYLNFSIWRAADDDQIPLALTQSWVRTIRRAGFRVEYQVVPFSTHLGGYFHDIEGELNARVSPYLRAGANRPQR